MFEIQVGNKKFENHYSGMKIYVGRPSVPGNPFAAKSSRLAQFEAKTDEEAVELYRAYLWRKIKSQDPQIIGVLLDIAQKAQAGKVVLLCWCVSRAGEGHCHARTIKKAVHWLYQTKMSENKTLAV